MLSVPYIILSHRYITALDTFELFAEQPHNFCPKRAVLSADQT